MDHVELRRFGGGEVAARLAAILGGEPSPAVAAEVFDRSGGNAYLVEEIAGVVREGKPLYYALQAEGVLFGSEPKAVLAHPQFRAEIDSEGLAELFSQIGTATPRHPSTGGSPR